MAHENVSAEATDVKSARCLVRVALAGTCARCIACVGALSCTYACYIANVRIQTLFIAPRYQQACRIAHAFKRKTLRRRSHCRGGSGLLS